MKKLNHEEIKQAWIKYVTAQSRLWLYHIDKKKSHMLRLSRMGRVPIFEEAELLFNMFSFMNWLAHIDMRNDHHIDEKDLTKWVTDITSWPPDIVEAFWYCMRNPTMHTGQTSVFSEYERKSVNGYKLYAGLNPDLKFDPRRFQPKEFKPDDIHDGWSAYATDDPCKLEATFYFAGIRRKLDIMTSMVTQNIQNADNNTLASLYKLNRKLLIFRVS